MRKNSRTPLWAWLAAMLSWVAMLFIIFSEKPLDKTESKMYFWGDINKPVLHCTIIECFNGNDLVELWGGYHYLCPAVEGKYQVCIYGEQTWELLSEGMK